MAYMGRQGVGSSKRQVDEDDQDDEEGDGGNGQRRYQAHHLLNDIQPQILVLQTDVMPDHLDQLSDGLDILVARKPLPCG